MLPRESIIATIQAVTSSTPRVLILKLIEDHTQGKSHMSAPGRDAIGSLQDQMN